MDQLRIVIADDNYLVREGVRRLLEDSGDVHVEAAVSSAPDLLDAMARLRPAAVLTDIRMPVGPPDGQPSMKGIEAARRAAGDGAGPRQRGHRRGAVLVRVLSGEARH